MVVGEGQNMPTTLLLPPRFESLTRSLQKMRPDKRDIMVKYANESYCGKISLYVMGVFCVELSLKKQVK